MPAHSRLRLLRLGHARPPSEPKKQGGSRLPRADRPPGKLCSGSHPPLGSCQSPCQKPQAGSGLPRAPATGLRTLRLRSAKHSTDASGLHRTLRWDGGPGKAAAAVAVAWAGRPCLLAAEKLRGLCLLLLNSRHWWWLGLHTLSDAFLVAPTASPSR